MASTGLGDFPIGGDRITRQALTQTQQFGSTSDTAAQIAADYFFGASGTTVEATGTASASSTATAVGAAKVSAAGSASGSSAATAEGDFALAQAAVTSGAGAFTPAEIAAHKARQRRVLTQLPDARLSPEEAQLLAQLLQQMRDLRQYPERPGEPEISGEIEEAAQGAMEAASEPQEAAEIDMEMSAPFLAQEAPAVPQGLLSEIAELRATLDRLIQARQEAEDDDIEALLLLAA